MLEIKIFLKVYCFSRLPKGFCKEKASSRFAKWRKGKTGQNLWKTEQQVVTICSGHLCNSNQKTQNRCTKDNYIENAVEKIQTKKMIWWFYTNFSIQGQNLFPGQHLTTFELSSNRRLYLAQIWKAKIQWWCYSSKQHQDTTKAKNLFMWTASQKRFLLCL